MREVSVRASILDTGEPVTITWYEETDAVYAQDSDGNLRQSQRTHAARLSVEPDDRTLTWSGKPYRYESIEEVEALVAAVGSASDAAPGHAGSSRVSAPQSAAAARGKAQSAGSLLEVLGWIYGALALLGGIVLAFQEDSFGDRPFVGVGIALGFAGLIVATLLVALGRFITAWVRTADEQAATRTDPRP